MTPNKCFEIILHISLYGSVLGVLVLCVNYCFKKYLSAAMRYALLLVVLLRFALPLSIPSEMSLFGLSGKFSAPQNMTLQELPISETEIVLPYNAIDFEQYSTVPASFSPAEEKTETASNVAPHERKGIDITWKFCVFMLWCCGVVLFVARLFWCQLRLAAKQKSWIALDSPELQLLCEKCRKHLGLRRRIRLYVATESIGAASYGIFRAKIVLSENMIRNLDAEEMRFVLLHEMLHHKRLDPLVHFCAQIVKAFHWVNPLLWIVLRQLEIERELAVDQGVIQITGTENAPVYGNVVLKTVRLCRNINPSPLFLGLQNQNQILERRIKMIIKPQISSRIRWFFGVLLVVGFAVTGLTDAKMENETKIVSPPNPISETDNTTEIENAREITGTVKDENGNGIENAWVGCGEFHILPFTCQTDSQGNFRLRIPEEQEITMLYAFKKGTGIAFFGDWKERRDVPLPPQRPDPLPLDKPFDMVIAGCRTIKVKVVNEDGEPLENQDVRVVSLLQHWQGDEISMVGPFREWNSTTDSQGVAVFDWIPRKDVCEVKFVVEQPSFFDSKTIRRVIYRSRVWSERFSSDIVTLKIPKATMHNAKPWKPQDRSMFNRWFAIRTNLGSHILIREDAKGEFSFPSFNMYICARIDSLRKTDSNTLDTKDETEEKQLNTNEKKEVKILGAVFDPQGNVVTSNASIEIIELKLIPEDESKFRRFYHLGSEEHATMKILKNAENPGIYEYTLPSGQFEVRAWNYEQKLKSDSQIITVDGTEKEIWVDLHLKNVSGNAF